MKYGRKKFSSLNYPNHGRRGSQGVPLFSQAQAIGVRTGETCRETPCFRSCLDVMVRVESGSLSFSRLQASPLEDRARLLCCARLALIRIKEVPAGDRVGQK